MENIAYYEKRIDFVARAFLHGGMSLENIKENQEKIRRLMDDYLEVSGVSETTDTLPLSFLALKGALEKIN